MNKRFLTGALFAGTMAVSFVAQTDSAAAISLVDLDLTGANPLITPGSNVPQLVIPLGNTEVTATITGFANAARQVSQNAAGLGVFGGGGDDPEVDGFGPDETLQVLFSKEVTLTGISLANVGFFDELALFVDGAFFDDAFIPGPNIGDTGTGAFTLSATGTTFGFTVTDFNDDFLLSGLQVEVVPTPALLPGLLGLGAAALRKRRKGAAEAEA